MEAIWCLIGRLIGFFSYILSSIPSPRISLSKPDHNDFYFCSFVYVYLNIKTPPPPHTHTLTYSFLNTCGSENHWRGNQSVRLRPLPHLPNRTLILFTHFPSSAWLCASEKPWRVGNHGVPLWLCDFWHRCLMKFWPLGPEEKFTDRNWVYGFREGFLCCLKRCTWSGSLIFSLVIAETWGLGGAPPEEGRVKAGVVLEDVVEPLN